MKHHLLSGIAAFCLVATSFASDYATITLQKSTRDYGGYHGMKFALDANYESDSIQNFGNDLSKFTAGNQVYLDDIELTTRYTEIRAQEYAVDKTLKSTYITVSDSAGNVIATSKAPVMKVDKQGIKPAIVNFSFNEKPLISVAEQYIIHLFETIDGAPEPFRIEIYLTRDYKPKDKWGLLKYASKRYQNINTDYVPIIKISTSQQTSSYTTIALISLAALLLLGALLGAVLFFKKKQNDDDDE